MSATRKRPNYLVGGIVLCAFPAIALVALHANHTKLPAAFSILFALFFLYGLRAIIFSLFKFNIDCAVSWVIDAIGATGFAVFAFLVAWFEKDGWSGGLPFLPASWNQFLPRILFACGGLVAAVFAARLALKAWNVHRKIPDGNVEHR